MSNGILRVEGEKVVDAKGNSVILRGAGLGGWMNMENFMYCPPSSTLDTPTNVILEPVIRATSTNIEKPCSLC